MASYYKGFEFKTSLEAQWAAFFDLAGWSWWTNPREVENWKPDFLVNFPCSHSECGGSHTLLVSVLPVSNLEKITGHPCLAHSYQVEDAEGQWIADAGALFGNSPSVTKWEMTHGAGGGIEEVSGWVHNASEYWEKAKSLIK